MEYVIQFLSFFTLVFDFESINFANILRAGMEYIELTVVLAAALLAFVGTGQLSFLREKFTKEETSAAGVSAKIQQNPLRLFLRHQFFGGTIQGSVYPAGAEKISSLKFFKYNLVSSCIWFAALLVTGTGLRSAWINTVDHFGPFELELIAGILAAYGLFFIFGLFNQSCPKHFQKL